jgi:aspartyl/asparaginyl beta-hydroxylase (cupin superfamily)
VDGGDYYRIRDRYHLVLVSAIGSPMACGDEEAVMREGELWWFDNKKPHEAFNRSDEGRIHLIFDLDPPVVGVAAQELPHAHPLKLWVNEKFSSIGRLLGRR